MDLRKMGFTDQEVKDIAISTLALAFIFFYPGLSLLTSISAKTMMAYLTMVVVVFLAFVPHELAHKFTAMRYGAVSVYQMWPKGLKFALALALISGGRFVIAAPGAVMIYTSFQSMWGVHQVSITRKQNAYISLAGPLTNIIIGSIALSLIPLFSVAKTVAYVSFFLAFFNLLPVPPLDGSKVFAWDKRVWFGLIAMAYLLQGIIPF